MNAAGPSVSAEAKAEGRPCFKCGYRLRGVPLNGQCPECGSPVADSFRGTLLQFASPEYLATIHSGLSLVLYAILASIVIGVVSIAASLAASAVGPGASKAVQAILQIVSLGLAVVTFLGYLRVTEPDPMFTGEEKPESARNIARIAAVASIAVAAIQMVLTFVATAGSGGLMNWLIMGVGLLGFAAWAVQFFAMMNYARWLGERIPDALIIKNATRYRWLLPVLATVGVVLIGLGPLIALILYWNLLDRLRKHVKSIRQTGAPANLPKMKEPAPAA